MRQTLKEAIFGAADGANAGIAVVFGQDHLLLAFALLMSVMGALSMAQGELVGAFTEPGRSIRSELPAVTAMGVATFCGTFIPTIPALISHAIWARILTVILGIALAILIGHLIDKGRLGYIASVVSFAGVLIPTVVLAIALGLS